MRVTDVLRDALLILVWQAAGWALGTLALRCADGLGAQAGLFVVAHISVHGIAAAAWIACGLWLITMHVLSWTRDESEAFRMLTSVSALRDRLSANPSLACGYCRHASTDAGPHSVRLRRPAFRCQQHATLGPTCDIYVSHSTFATLYAVAARMEYSDGRHQFVDGRGQVGRNSDEEAYGDAVDRAGYVESVLWFCYVARYAPPYIQVVADRVCSFQAACDDQRTAGPRQGIGRLAQLYHTCARSRYPLLYLLRGIADVVYQALLFAATYIEYGCRRILGAVAPKSGFMEDLERGNKWPTPDAPCWRLDRTLLWEDHLYLHHGRVPRSAGTSSLANGAPQPVDTILAGRGLHADGNGLERAPLPTNPLAVPLLRQHDAQMPIVEFRHDPWADCDSVSITSRTGDWRRSAARGPEVLQSEDAAPTNGGKAQAEAVGRGLLPGQSPNGGGGVRSSAVGQLDQGCGELHAAGERVRTFDLAKPYDGPTREYGERVSAATCNAGTRVRRIEPQGRHAEKTARMQSRFDELEGYLAEGMDYGPACERAGIPEQARYLLPIPKGKERYVANIHSSLNELGAMRLRTLAGDNRGMTNMAMKERLTNISIHLAEYCISKTHGSHQLRDLMPKSWSEKHKIRSFEQATGIRPDSLSRIQKYFVKMNESLEKPKARGISAPHSEVTVIQCAQCAVLEHSLFENPLFLERSIKHADAEELNARMQRRLKNFRTGCAVSIDFSSWDGTILNDLRNCTENTFLLQFSSHFHPRDGQALESMQQRLRDTLHLRGRFWQADTSIFGRQSGDRGTSVLNYIVNFIIHMAFEQELHEIGIAEQIRRREKDQSSVDAMFEGDDYLLLLSKNAMKVGKRQVLASMLRFYSDLGLKLEPAGPQGQVTNDIDCFADNCSRVEFVSRLWVTDDKGYVFSYPKLPKTLATTSVTFSKVKMENVGASASLSCMYNTVSCPLLFELYHCMLQFWSSKGGRDNEEIDYHTRMMQAAARRRRMPALEWVIRMRENAKQRTDHMARKDIEREHPRLTESVQRSIEERLAVAGLAARSNVDDAWRRAGGAVELLLSLL